MVADRGHDWGLTPANLVGYGYTNSVQLTGQISVSKEVASYLSVGPMQLVQKTEVQERGMKCSKEI